MKRGNRVSSITSLQVKLTSTLGSGTIALCVAILRGSLFVEVDLVDRQTIEKKRFDRTFRHLLVIGNRWSRILGNIDVFRLIGTNSIDQRFEKRRIYAEWNLKVSYPMYIRFFRYRKDTFASFTRHQQFQKNHSRLFLNAIPSPLLGEPLSLSSSSPFFTKVPKTLQKRPVDHSSNVTRSRFIILKAASAPPKIKMRSPLVVEQHFNLAYVLSNPIYINPPPRLLSTQSSTHGQISRDTCFRTSLARRFIYFKRDR